MIRSHGTKVVGRVPLRPGVVADKAGYEEDMTYS